MAVLLRTTVNHVTTDNSCDYDRLTGAFGGDEEEERNEDGELVSVVEARREAEEKRRQKHQQMDAEREEIRDNIRKKVKQTPPCQLTSSQLFFWH